MAQNARKPNIVYILADDQGYGDVQCFNPGCKAPTPCLDRLAAGGMRFTDAHTSSAVCTPTRYSILTGRYNWRSWLKSGVLTGESPPLLENGRPTVASFLREHGYRTACVGKWHLGLGWRTKDDEPFPEGHTDWKGESHARIDFSRPLSSSPNDFGFDESFIIPASLDIPPYVYVENGRCTAIPTEENELGVDTPYLMRKGIAAPGMRAEDVLPTFTRRAVETIDRHFSANADQPLFLYFPLTAPHTPIVPAKEYRGRTEIGLYGDFVTQIDAVAGEIMDALSRNGQDGNTLLVFTSDNGASPAAKLDELAAMGHEPNAPWRGHKADLYEGGHRTPLIARWPDVTPAGSVSGQTVCTTDLFATVAGIIGAAVPEGAGEDSRDLGPLFCGEEPDGDLREATVHHSVSGHFAIRRGKWKLLEARGSGGWSFPREEEAEKFNLPPVQLFNLEEDPRESMNLAPGFPEVVKELQALLERYRAEGRSVRHGG
jgi:arylsulfatase A